MTENSFTSRLFAVLSGSIARGSIIALAVRLTGLALIFIQSVIAANLLGVSEYGVVTLLLSIIQITAGVVLFGFGSLAVAEIPRLMRKEHSRAQLIFARHALGRIAAFCLFALPIAWGAAYVILDRLSIWLVIPALLCVPLLAAIQLFRGIAVGLARPFWGVAPGELFRPLLFVAFLVTAGLSWQLDAVSFMALYMASAFLAFGFAAPTIRTHKSANAAPLSVDSRTWDREALPFLGIHLAAILQVELATIMLGIFATPEAAGLFQPVSRISMLLMLPFYALSVGFNPKISALHAEGKLSDIARLSHKHMLASTGALVIASSVIGLLSPFILGLFGPEFVAGVPLVWVLIVGRIAQAVLGPGAEVLAMTGHSKRAVSCLALSLAFEALVSAILIPSYGLMGAAVAVTAGLIIRALSLAFASKSALNIGLTEFWRGRLPNGLYN